MSRTDDLTRELRIHRDELSDELARLDQVLVILEKKEQKPRGITKTNGDMVCPECGKKFETPQGLGAHRQRVHGHTGGSKRTHSRRLKVASREVQETILAEIANHGPTSKAHLEKTLDYSPSTIGTGITTLRREKLIVESGRETIPTGGTRPLYSISSRKQNPVSEKPRDRVARIEDIAPQVQPTAPDMSGTNQEGDDGKT